MPNYLIPEELSKISTNMKFLHTSSNDPKVIFLAPSSEKFFLNFPKAWETPLKDNLSSIYEDGANRYSFTISTYDGEKISSYSLNMLGLEFKDYLAGILKFSKTISLSVACGTKAANYIICKA